MSCWTANLLRQRGALLIACAFMPLMAQAAGEGQPGKPPNVLIFLADDLGYSDLGCYGGEIATPHLDRLAAEGVRFTRFHDSGRCWTTRAALLSGYHAQQVRRDRVEGLTLAVQGNRPRWALLLPQLLAPLGYRSYHSGKWHLDGTPTQGGFDRAYYLEDTGNYFAPKVHYEDDVALPPVTEEGFFLTAAIADFAISCLQTHAAEYPERPFFQYVAFTAPHHPLHAEPADLAAYDGAYDEGFESVRARRWERIQSLGLVRGQLSAVERNIGAEASPEELDSVFGHGEFGMPLAWDGLDEEQRAFQAAKMEIYAAMITVMDREIGRVLEQVRAMGASDDTLVLFLSDNGACAEIQMSEHSHDRAAPPGSEATYLCLGPGWSSVGNTPFRRHKSWVHEGGTATPLIARWPGHLEHVGGLRGASGHVVDLLPTLLELAGGERPSEYQGRVLPRPPGVSLVEALLRDGPRPSEEQWFSHEGHRAFQLGNWKLVAARGDPWELYDLENDPTETRDLAGEHPERVIDLRARWHLRNDEYAGDAGASDSPPRPGREVVKKLPSLGEAFMLGERPAFVLLPSRQQRSSPQPWVLFTPSRPEYPGSRELWMLQRLLGAGVAVAGIDTGPDFGGREGRAALDALFEHLVTERDFSPRPCLLARDDGGLTALAWAAEHPERVAGLAGVTPAFDLRSYPGITLAAEARGLTPAELRERLEAENPIGGALALAQARVPAFLVHDPLERTMLSEGALSLERTYAAAGAAESISTLAVGEGSDPLLEASRCIQLVKFLLEHAL